MTLGCMPGSRRPFQAGLAIGTRAGHVHQEPVDWLIDSGADWSAVRPSVASAFDTHSPPVPPANTAPPGRAAYYLANGIQVQYTAMDAANAGPVTLTASTPIIAIKHREVGSNIIGMPELASEGVTLCRNARLCTGELIG